MLSDKSRLINFPANVPIAIGERWVRKQGKDYSIYLPRRMRGLWEVLNKHKIPVEVYIIVREVPSAEGDDQG